MTAYIEYVIIDNFSVTLLVAALTYRLILRRVPWPRALLGAAVGTVCAVLSPFIANFYLLLFFKIAVWAGLSLLLFYRKKRFFMASLLFLGITFAFGGAMFALGYMATSSVEAAMDYEMFDFPVGLLLLAAVLVFKGLQILGLKLYRIKDIGGLTYECRIQLFEGVVTLHGMMDTGNRLYDRTSGLPVVVVNAKSLMPVLSDEQFRLLFSGQGEKLQRGAHYIGYGTLSTEKSRILLYKPDKFLLYLPDRENILYDVMLGVTFGGIREKEEYDAILHPALL
ncbi:MAG: sigma-E processing peptidase SpoIIGA [Clostridiales bacterium]|jgi:sigma-E processing peptidase SpoIIGA|nr:sigma-E processing peptidase SpoIIGA [Clostridiales bacterium]